MNINDDSSDFLLTMLQYIAIFLALLAVLVGIWSEASKELRPTWKKPLRWAAMIIAVFTAVIAVLIQKFQNTQDKKKEALASETARNVRIANNPLKNIGVTISFTVPPKPQLQSYINYLKKNKEQIEHDYNNIIDLSENGHQTGFSLQSTSAFFPGKKQPLLYQLLSNETIRCRFYKNFDSTKFSRELHPKGVDDVNLISPDLEFFVGPKDWEKYTTLDYYFKTGNLTINLVSGRIDRTDELLTNSAIKSPLELPNCTLVLNLEFSSDGFSASSDPLAEDLDYLRANFSLGQFGLRIAGKNYWFDGPGFKVVKGSDDINYFIIKLPARLISQQP